MLIVSIANVEAFGAMNFMNIVVFVFCGLLSNNCVLCSFNRYVNQVSVRRHQQLTKCVGYKMGAKGTTTITKIETSPAATIKTERQGGRKRTPIEQTMTDSTSQEGSDSSFSAGITIG